MRMSVVLEPVSGTAEENLEQARTEITRVLDYRGSLTSLKIESKETIGARVFVNFEVNPKWDLPMSEKVEYLKQWIPAKVGTGFKVIGVFSSPNCQFCGRDSDQTYSHHWYQPPQLERYTAIACPKCNQLLTRKNLMHVPSVADIPYSTIERKARELWRECYAQWIEDKLRALEGMGRLNLVKLSRSAAWEVEILLRRSERSPSDGWLKSFEDHILPSFEEQVAFIHRQEFRI